MLITWEALAFVLAILPGIVGVIYCYTCGRFRKLPSLTGYLDLLKISNKAKNKAYRKTAGLFSQIGAPIWIVCFLAWFFSVIVELMGPNPILIVVLLLLALPFSAIAYFIGKAMQTMQSLMSEA
jgi:membrane protein DedA with SNARE-associated domain